MIKFILLLCLNLTTASLSLIFSQKTEFKIKLKPKETHFNLEFNCLKVIDNRENTSNIGYVNKWGNKLPANIHNGLTEGLESVLNYYLPPISARPNLVFIIHELSIKEVIYQSFQVGLCDIEIEIARISNDSLFSLGIFESKVANRRKDVTCSHGKRILKALKECLYAFSITNWKLKSGKHLDLNKPKYDFNSNLGFKEGIYLSFAHLAKRYPDGPINSGILKKVNARKEEKNYRFIKKKDKNPLNRYCRFIVNGKDIFVFIGEKSSRRIYLKAKHVGKYFYLEDRYPDPQIGPYFGIIGIILSDKKKAIVFDTENNELKELSDFNIFLLTKDYPEILEQFKNSKRKLLDREKIIIELNKKK